MKSYSDDVIDTRKFQAMKQDIVDMSSRINKQNYDIQKFYRRAILVCSTSSIISVIALLIAFYK